MALTTQATALAAILNLSPANAMFDIMRQLGFGSMVRALPTYVRNGAPALNPYNLSTVWTLGLPDDARANTAFDAYARAGSGTAGKLVFDGITGTAPAAGHFAVTPNGDLAFATADAWTNVDVTYLPEKQDVVEVTLPVTSNVMTLPTGLGQLMAAGVVTLIEAEALAGTVTGKCIVVSPSNSAPGTTKEANLNLAKATVLFTVADAVTSARVKVGVVCAIDVNTLLETVAGAPGTALANSADI